MYYLTSSELYYNFMNKYNTQNQDAHNLTGEALEPLVLIQYDKHPNRGLEQHTEEKNSFHRRDLFCLTLLEDR